MGSDIMACWVTPFPMTLSDLKGRWHVECHFRCHFYVQLCSSFQDFNWHGASRGPSALAEFLVTGMPWRCHRALLLWCQSRSSVSVSFVSCADAVVHRDPSRRAARSDRSHHIRRSLSHHGTMIHTLHWWPRWSTHSTAYRHPVYAIAVCSRQLSLLTCIVIN